MACCLLLSELRTRVTDDTESEAAAVPFQVLAGGCVTIVHETTPVTFMVVDGHTIRLFGDTFLYAFQVLHRPTQRLTADAVHVHQLRDET